MKDILPGQAWEDFHPEMFRVALTRAADLVTSINKQNGWFVADRTIGDEVALLHSEASEMLEEFRAHGMSRGFENKIDVTDQDGDEHVVRLFENLMPVEPYPAGMKPLGVGSECADILIRLLDFCDRYNINLAEETINKLQYNETRGYRHGGKAL